MLLLLDTSTPTCFISVIDGDKHYEVEWLAERKLASGLLTFLREQLTLHNYSWSDVKGIGVYRGPGSFTGLRIGLTVLNTFADTSSIPIVGTTGDNWQNDAMIRLEAGENDHIVLPFYGSDAHITKQRK
jgi:tRNA threonylcarbamoyladenosine biosynthesis protein TsaB